MARERKKANEEVEASLLDRRSYLKLAGTAVAAVAASSANATAADSSGYGAGGFGEGEYGSSGPTNPAPTIERFDVAKSEQLGDSRMFTVKWAVADAGEDLDVVEIVVASGPSDVDFSVFDVAGAKASDYTIFQFPVGTTLDVTVKVTDAAGTVTKDTRTVSL